MIVVLIVTVAMMALTWLLGWWGVVTVALVAGLLDYRSGGGGWRLALAGALSWSALLAVNAASGSLGIVAATLGGIQRVPGVALVLLTIAYPALLAWSAGTVAGETRRLLVRRRRELPT
jgi:hypothetical protein